MEYSEDITNEEILSYTGRRRKSNVVVQPKWKLNSGWLKEQLFPFYESIYISPILKEKEALIEIYRQIEGIFEQSCTWFFKL